MGQGSIFYAQIDVLLVSYIMSAIIFIYAQFLKVVVLNTELELNPSNWKWRHCLNFPVNKLNRF